VQPLGFSLDDRAVRRSGLDYWARVVPHLHVWPTWAALEAELPALGTPFFFAPRAARDFREARYPDGTVLVFGCESVGLSQEILARHAADTVSIPMIDPELRSLNLSTTVAVAAYEVQRQWAAG
jgi:tRNA (cytidine/uridine-2'-O-)-methyltransferase